MKLVTMKTLLDKAYKNHYAVPAINVSNMETVNALFEVADKLKAPVILQIAPIQIVEQNVTYDYLVELIKFSAKRYNGEYAIHLDHGGEIKDIEQAVSAQFTSVMLDGSKHPFETNVELVQKARKIAGDITLEGELGILNEEASDEEVCEMTTNETANSFHTDPDLAKEFVTRTGVDCLAVSIGNAHGIYKGVPKLNFDILAKINENIKMPIVLHGASGLSDEDIGKSITLGVSKINFFTAVDYAFTRGIKKTLDENPGTYMMTYIENGRQEMMCEIEKCINMCHANGMLK